MGGSFQLIAIVTLALLLPTVPAAPAEGAALDATLREQVREIALAHGIAPDDLLAAAIVIETVGIDGTVTSESTTIEEWIRSLPQATIGNGVGGSPHMTAGDFLHLYINVASGNALGYHVQDSFLVPHTPAVVAPGIPLYHVGGPLRHVSGTFALGLHTVGTVIGSNVDTHGSGPYLPVVDGDLVADSSIDFLGAAEMSQGQTCFFGLCIAVGTMIADGVANWDGEVPLVSVP